jgi:hypothetical protein
MMPLNELSNVELRLELAEAEYQRPKTLKGICQKRNRIAAVTALLVERGAF